MGTLISLDDQHVWSPPMHKSDKESSGKASFCKQQEQSQRDRAARLPRDGSVLPRSALLHCQITSNNVIIISSDEESETDDEDDGLNDTFQSSRPRESHSSVAGSDASGEWDDSYHGRADEKPPRFLGTADDHTITGPPADEQDPVQTEVISSAQSSSVTDDFMETPFSPFVSMPQTLGCSDEMAPGPTDSFEAALEPDDERCPSHQLEIGGAPLPNYDHFVDNLDNAETSADVRQAREGSPMLVQPGARSFGDATVRNPIQEDKLSNASSDHVQDLGHSRQVCHTVESEAQSLKEAHSGAATMDNREGRTRMHKPCDGNNKRRRRKAREPAGEGSDSDDEFIPTRKLRNVSSYRRKQNPGHYRKSKRCVPKRQVRKHEKISPTSGGQHLDTTIVSRALTRKLHYM